MGLMLTTIPRRYISAIHLGDTYRRYISAIYLGAPRGDGFAPFDRRVRRVKNAARATLAVGVRVEPRKQFVKAGEGEAVTVLDSLLVIGVEEGCIRL